MGEQAPGNGGATQSPELETKSARGHRTRASVAANAFELKMFWVAVAVCAPFKGDEAGKK